MLGTKVRGRTFKWFVSVHPFRRKDVCEAMSDRDRTKTSGDAQRVREHVRTMLSRLAAYQQEKRRQEGTKAKVKQERD